MLDPACGSGNFLYLALHALKDIEHRVQLEAETLGLPRGFPAVGPANVKGIEINAYAAELARVSVWIGEIQWMRRNGFSNSTDPILDPLDTIECRDAILAPDGSEPDWPEADVVIGNPPFLGGKLLIGGLGEDYVSRMFAAWQGRVPQEADLVCYWFVKAGGHIAASKAKRAGLVATNSIRGGANRRALQAATDGRPIFEALSDEPWIIDGAAVRVSLVCFADASAEPAIDRRLDGRPVDEIHADLTARRGAEGIDLTGAGRLRANAGTAFMGDTKGGPFDIPGALAREWLRLPANPNGLPNADVLKPWMNGMDMTRRPAGKWIVDFGWDMTEEDAALYEAPFAHVAEHVRPMRQRNRREAYRAYWWRHVEPRQGMWRALEGLPRFIATPTVAKHRLFAWLDAGVCPDHQLIVIARDDDTAFGILHSRFHEAWSLRLGSSLEDRPRYTPTTTFETFPFPEGLSPDIPAADYAEDPRAQAIAEAARRLVELRGRWLNPPEWVEWQEEPTPGYPPRPVPRNEETARELRKRTLTNLYNARPQWLVDAHAALDTAVAAAYGWDAEIGEEEVLGKLLGVEFVHECLIRISASIVTELVGRMAMSIPKRHHTTPIMLIKNFVDSEDSLHVGWPNHIDRGIARMKPHQALVRTHFHTLTNQDGSRDTHVEARLSERESLWSPIVDKIIEQININQNQSGQHILLARDEIKLMKQLAFIQFWRSSDNYRDKKMNEFLKGALSSFETEFGISVSKLAELNPKQKLSDEDLSRIKDNSRVSAINSALDGEPSSLKMVMEKNLAVCVIRNPNKCFITGSSPVVNNSTEQKPLYHSESCLFLPIANHIALQLMNTEDIVPTMRDGTVVYPPSNQWIRSLNVSITRQSETIVGRSRQLIESLCRNRG